MHLLLASAAEHGSGSIDVLILIPELIVIALVAVAVKYVRLPYTIALVAAGLGIGLLKASHYLELDIRLTPAMIFTVFLPALLFEAAFNLHFEYLQRNLKPILTLAVVGGSQMVLGTFIDPLIQDRFLKLSAFTIFLAVFAFGWIWGPWGALIGVPITFIFGLLVREFPRLEALGVLLVGHNHAAQQEEG